MNKHTLFYTIKQILLVDQRSLRMRICQPIGFIQRICVEFAGCKFNANFARKVADDLQMRAYTFVNASTRKRKFNGTRTKFHLSPTVNALYTHISKTSRVVCVRERHALNT